MALPSSDYRDPLEIIISREQTTCRGCIHQHTATVFGKGITICIKTTPDGKRRNHGKRCKDYVEKQGAAT